MIIHSFHSLTLVHNTITCRILEGFPTTGIEFLATRINIGSYRIILINTYLPPSPNRNIHVQELDFILQLIRHNYPQDAIIITGDLNMSKINWNLFGSDNDNDTQQSLRDFERTFINIFL